jgi:hypothetical protein
VKKVQYLHDDPYPAHARVCMRMIGCTLPLLLC